MVGVETTWNDISVSKLLIINKRKFIPPPNDGSSLNDLIITMCSLGAGRKLDKYEPYVGPWTPILLAAAISEIKINKSGVELRTVQRWFQGNDVKISNQNIRWLAMLFGCEDPEATGEWQLELSRAKLKDKLKHRENTKAAKNDNKKLTTVVGSDSTSIKQRICLARTSESLFSRKSSLDLPASVFGCAVVLGFLAVLVNIHSVFYSPVEGSIKQVGFLWAPNWTLLFMAFMPMFLSFVSESIRFWKDEGRLKLLDRADRTESDDGWVRNVQFYSFTYWTVLLVCLPVFGVFQWVATRLTPLLNSSSTGDRENYAIDWGAIAIAHADVASIPETIWFTGIAYLYMSICFYIFFAGLILLYTMINDFGKMEYQSESNEIGFVVMSGVFRCTISGLMIPICMKLQSFYLDSTAVNIVYWLVHDLLSVFDAGYETGEKLGFSLPTHFSSLIIALATGFVFIYGSVRITPVWRTQGKGSGHQFHARWLKMVLVVALLFISYLLIDAFSGFSIVLTVCLLLGIYSIFDPGLDFRRTRISDEGNN